MLFPTVATFLQFTPRAGFCQLCPTQDKVDVVKMTMQDNIQQMLANEERLDQISENAENLNEQVRVLVVP